MQCCSYLEIEALQLGETSQNSIGVKAYLLSMSINTWPKFAFSIVLIWSGQHFGCPVLLLLMTKYTWPHDQSFFFKRWYTWLMASHKKSLETNFRWIKNQLLHDFSCVLFCICCVDLWRIAMEKTSSMARSPWLITWFHGTEGWKGIWFFGSRLWCSVGHLRRQMCMRCSGLSEVQRWVFLTPSTIGLGLNWPAKDIV